MDDYPLLHALGLDAEKARRWDAWSKATQTLNADVRIDCDGKLIKWDDYGEDTEYGWEVDHITPLVLGGLDVASNRRARHRHGNRSAGGTLGGLMRLGAIL